MCGPRCASLYARVCAPGGQDSSSDINLDDLCAGDCSSHREAKERQAWPLRLWGRNPELLFKCRDKPSLLCLHSHCCPSRGELPNRTPVRGGDAPCGPVQQPSTICSNSALSMWLRKVRVCFFFLILLNLDLNLSSNMWLVVALLWWGHCQMRASL